jgi:hypothetical protein
MLSIQLLANSVVQTETRGHASTAPAASAVPTAAADAANGTQSTIATAPAAARQALNQSLQQALNQWRQQQSVLQKQAQTRKQNNSQPLDASRMEMLKDRVKNLRQMLLLVGRDKSGLRAIALQLKQISAELRQMVANATGQAQSPEMTLTVNATAGGSGQGEGGEEVVSAEDAASSAPDTAQAAAQADSSAATAAPSTDHAAASSGLAVGSGMASGLNGNMDLQALINSIKAIQQWLRQRQQQTPDAELKQSLDASSKDMAAIANMLNGGGNSAEGDASLTLVLADAASDGGNVADAVSSGANAQA